MAKTRKRNLIGLLETNEHECRRIWGKFYFERKFDIVAVAEYPRCQVKSRDEREIDGIIDEKKQKKTDQLVGSLKVFLASSWVSLHRFLARSPASGAH